MQYAENSGAFLSLGASLPEPRRYLGITIVAAIFLLGLFAFVLFSRGMPPYAIVCLALVCTDGLSDLIDRVAHEGRVVDFLNIGIGSLRTGICNVADMAITAAAISMVIDSFRQKPDPEPRT